MPAENKVVICPECDKEVKVTFENGSYDGSCEGCGLDVAAVLNRRRYEKALDKVRKREEDQLNAATPPKKKNVFDSL